MELMSLHQLYKLVYDQLKLTIPEPIVGKMMEMVSCTRTQGSLGGGGGGGGGGGERPLCLCSPDVISDCEGSSLP